MYVDLLPIFDKKTFLIFILPSLIFVLRILWFWLFACFMFIGFADIVSWFWVNAVWRHVLGDGDAVDEIDIALGKCNYLHISLHSGLQLVWQTLISIEACYWFTCLCMEVYSSTPDMVIHVF